MRYLPAVVRSQWGQMERKSDSAIIDKFTTAHVTPVLWQEEVERITTKRDTFDNMTVKVRSNVREVVASYNFNDEGSMEVVIQLPTRIGTSGEHEKSWCDPHSMAKHDATIDNIF